MPDSDTTTIRSSGDIWRTLVARVGLLALVALSAVMIASVLFQTIEAPARVGLPFTMLGLAAVSLMVWLLRHRIARYATAAADVAVRISPTRWLLGCFAVGAALRLAFALAFPTELYSDEAVYAALSVRLAEDGVYEIAGTRSFWPPGNPFFYFPSVALVGWQPWLPVAHNLLLLAATLWAVHRLAAWALNDRSARIASLIVTLWPNFSLLVTWPSKELLIAALLPMAVLLYLSAVRQPSGRLSVAATLGAGVCLGFAALAQPSTALFAVVLLAAVPLGPVAYALGRWLLVLAFAVLAVLPWSIRNHAIHGEIVPVSTNGGGVFLSANNPQATGGWMEFDMGPYVDDEIAAGRWAYREGLDWIANNPAGFLRLVPIKISRFFGDDDYSTQRTFFHQEIRGRHDDGIGQLLMWTSNVYWYLLIILITAGAFSLLRTVGDFDPRLTLIVGSIWYFVVIHAIFQSEAKHHLIIVAFLAIAASVPARGLSRAHGEAASAPLDAEH